MDKFHIVVVSNDDEILDRNLLMSPIVRETGVRIDVVRDAKSAAIAYNRILDQSNADYVIFVHQDVYLPARWLNILTQKISQITKLDPNWAVLAPTGMNEKDNHVGPVWSTSQGAVVGRELQQPEPVQSVDELMIILRRKSDIRFDDSLPGFHMFGTDIVQTARAMGKGAYVCQMPLVHNDQFHAQLGSDFAKAYQYVRTKWRAVLPLRTTVLRVTKKGVALKLYGLNAQRSLEKRRAISGCTKTDPRDYAKQCGWE